jgi:hypothetical protein
MGTSTPKLIVLKELVGNAPPHLDPLQQLLAPHIEIINDFWLSVWCMTLIVLLVKLFLDYREHRKKK